MKLEELKRFLELNKIKYTTGLYAKENESIIIKGKKGQLEVYENERGFVSDFHRIPYTYGRMGSTNMVEIIKDICEIKNIDFENMVDMEE